MDTLPSTSVGFRKLGLALVSALQEKLGITRTAVLQIAIRVLAEKEKVEAKDA